MDIEIGGVTLTPPPYFLSKKQSSEMIKETRLLNGINQAGALHHQGRPEQGDTLSRNPNRNVYIVPTFWGGIRLAPRAPIAQRRWQHHTGRHYGRIAQQ